MSFHVDRPRVPEARYAPDQYDCVGGPVSLVRVSCGSVRPAARMKSAAKFRLRDPHAIPSFCYRVWNVTVAQPARAHTCIDRLANLELPLYDGYPYWNRCVVGAIYHISQLPPVPEPLLLEATRRQAVPRTGRSGT